METDDFFWADPSVEVSPGTATSGTSADVATSPDSGQSHEAFGQRDTDRGKGAGLVGMATEGAGPQRAGDQSYCREDTMSQAEASGFGE